MKTRPVCLFIMDGYGLREEKDGNAVKSAIREWMSAMHDNPAGAKQLLQRAKQIYKKESKEYGTLEAATATFDRKDSDDKEKEACHVHPAYDIISLYSVIYQETK